ncbi:hypothetical protein P153DRAFT_381007 [Dothidotthia symphoricarpi CBS 119687]|uniref:Uncharacterized protein n=1 Tax=Dothidotthia symphoricarpi CBS 119687 TaxID=1392245 RepID=A0A6A6APH8_9PLEO|nr:uncharacterized protein P153DRAFT_381007 [Dothidotthia symphoricarpi CBS 119687]KAF2133829.1 hypothetical protein P153DRAFT_381007 [Dothidotthia symphoricarpi CBS 119687]
MYSILVIATSLFLSLAQAVPAPIEARADANCPPLAPYLVNSDPANAWNSVCTAYDVSWDNTCNRGTGPDPIEGARPLRLCTDAFFQV